MEIKRIRMRGPEPHGFGGLLLRFVEVVGTKRPQAVIDSFLCLWGEQGTTGRRGGIRADSTEVDIDFHPSRRADGKVLSHARISRGRHNHGEVAELGAVLLGLG